MKNNRYNWRVVAYDENNNVIEAWTIKDRTEREAEKEAIADLPMCDDWTMTKIKQKVVNI